MLVLFLGLFIALGVLVSLYGEDLTGNGYLTTYTFDFFSVYLPVRTIVIIGGIILIPIVGAGLIFLIIN